MKILIVQIGRIGDMILTTPMFRALHEHDHSAEIHVLTSPRGLPIVENNPHIHKIIVHDKGIIGLLRTIAAVRAEHYDIWIDPKDHASSEGTLLAQFSGAIKKIGFNKKGKFDFTVVIPSDEENVTLHAAERNVRTLSSLGIFVNSIPRPELFIDSKIENDVREMFGDSIHRIAIVNISAGNESRMWNDGSWSEVILLCIQKGFRCVIIFQPIDRTRAEFLHSQHPESMVFNSPTMHHVIALMSLSAIVISVDTSVVHVASAFNIPIVALYPKVEWNYDKFRPLSEKQIVLFSDDPKSLRGISTSAVVEKIDELINALKS